MGPRVLWTPGLGVNQWSMRVLRAAVEATALWRGAGQGDIASVGHDGGG